MDFNSEIWITIGEHFETIADWVNYCVESPSKESCEYWKAQMAVAIKALTEEVIPELGAENLSTLGAVKVFLEMVHEYAIRIALFN